LLAVTLVVGSLWAQPGSLTTTPLPVSGPAVFDAAGNLYFFQSGPATQGAAQTQRGGGECLFSNLFFTSLGPCPDAYVGKVDGAGTLVFGTYLGGSTADQSTALAVDATGNVFVTGSTNGSFPTTANAAIAASSTAKAFAAKLSADGSRFLYSTYLPDTVAATSAIAVDPQGNAYIAGTSRTGHAFVLKLSADGSTLLYNVSLAGTGEDAANAIMADAAGNVIVAGQTTSPDLPVSPGAVQTRLAGARNVFLAKLDAGGRVVFSTYLGGSGTDTPTAMRIDSAGNIYVAGQTSSLDFPTTSGSFEPALVVPLWNNRAPGGFAAKLKADGTALAWSSYVMSDDHSSQQGVAQLAVTATGEVYVAGITGAGFPVTASAPQICFDGPIYSGFVAHLDSHGALLDATYAGQNVAFVGGLSLTGDGSVLMVSISAGAMVKSQIHFGGAGWSAPACLSPSVLNSATMSGNSALNFSTAKGSSALTPGELITLTGSGIGPDIGVAYQPDAQGQIPRQLAGVQVLFDGQPAPVLYAQSRQINAVAPVELSGRTQTNITVLYNQATLGPITAPVAAYGSPGIYRLQAGVSSQAAAVNQDGTLNGPSNPAARGSVVSVWGTGFGLIDPSCATGGLNPPGPVNLAAGLSVFLADGSPPGVPVAYAPARYAGSAPALPCGVEQINLLVPTYVPPGLYQFFPWSAMDQAGGGQSVVQGGIGVTISVK
jgi:uncharacterized protein (TIGR03437 family)